MDRTKYATLQLTKTPTDGTGQFTAVVSTFGGAPDADNDVIAPGAYDQTIQEWAAKGQLPTLWWMHGYEDPLNAIGKLTAIYVAGNDLVVEGQLDLTNTRAQAVYEGMLTDKLNEFSIGYAVRAEHKDAGANVITNLELLEVSVVFAGANRNTRLIQIKKLMEEGAFIEAQALAAPLRRKQILDDWALEYPDLAGVMFRSTKGVEVATETHGKTAEELAEFEALAKTLAEPVGTVTVKVVADTTELEEALAKAGRVIGSKAANDLKSELATAIDNFVMKVNGDATPDPAAEKFVEVEDKIVEEAVIEVPVVVVEEHVEETGPLAELKARMDALGLEG